jgi:hypothetical protein
VTTAAAPKLTAATARKLHDAEVAVAQLEAQLKLAREARDELRDRVRPRLAPAADAEDRAKGILEGRAGGVLVRVAPAVSGESFSLKRYVEAGHRITAAMRDAISPGRPYDRWTVKPAAGPKKLGAVEPAA